MPTQHGVDAPGRPSRLPGTGTILPGMQTPYRAGTGALGPADDFLKFLVRQAGGFRPEGWPRGPHYEIPLTKEPDMNPSTSPRRLSRTLLGLILVGTSCLGSCVLPNTGVPYRPSAAEEDPNALPRAYTYEDPNEQYRNSYGGYTFPRVGGTYTSRGYH